MRLEGKTTKCLGLGNGKDNTRGFTNGLTNGFTNGNGYRNSRKLKESRSHGKILAVFVLAMLVLSVVAFLTWQSNGASAIIIDGNFKDWQRISKTTKPNAGDVPDNIDIAEYATAETGKNVAFYFKVYGNLLAGDGKYFVEASSGTPVYVSNHIETAIPNANGRDLAYVFIDIDANPSTGFKPSDNFAVGADRALEILGKNGKIEASRVLSFAGVVQHEWAWNIGETVASATNGKELETMAGKNQLGIKEKYAVYFYMIDWQNIECKLENALLHENAKVSQFNLYLSAHTKVRVERICSEIKATPHAPIHINGNGQFDAAHGVIGGDGSQANPYIIENYEINANGGSYGIWIENTTAYFIVRNCTVYNATAYLSEPEGAGIALNNVTNGKLEYNICNESRKGIRISGGSNHNIITNNNVHSNTYTTGISLVNSTNNTVINNSVWDNAQEGIYLYNSSYNTIRNNNVSENGNGIYLDRYSKNNTIINNIVTSNSLSGIVLSAFSANNTITSNNVSGNNEYGIYLNGANYNIFSYNLFYNNAKYGINITSSCTGNIIHHNNFIRNNGASRGVSGKSQAYDSVGGNSWYESVSRAGNYWSNWDGTGWGTSSAYPIDGGGGESDNYPLSKRVLAPLHINGNSEFSFMKTLYGWPGDGSRNNPYLIGNYNIDGNDGSYGIWIESTTCYFSIRNCSISNATDSANAPYGAGLALRNVNNGTVENNTYCTSRMGIFIYSNSKYNQIINNNLSSNTYYGLLLQDSTYNNVTGCTATNNDLYGIYLASSARYNNITNNNASNNYGTGIYLESANYNTLSGNKAYENMDYGFGLNGATNNLIIGNDASRNDHYGLYLDASSNRNNITNNKISDNWYGVYIYSSDQNTITRNDVINNTNGVYFSFCNNTNITNNNITNNADKGIHMYYSTNNSVTNNNISANTHGVYLHNSNYNIIANNNATGNTYGIYFASSSNNTIANNNASANSQYGVYLYYSSNNNSASGNNVSNCYSGIYLSTSSYYNMIKNNTATNNTYSGIYLSYSNNNTMEGNIISYNSVVGMMLYASSNSTIRNNTISNNNNYGIYLSQANNNIITGNQITSNTNYGIYITSVSTGNYIHHNYFIRNNGAVKNVNGNCQAYDDVGGNYWYDTTVNEGNYWSNWDGQDYGTPSAYPINGGAGASDWYPLPVSNVHLPIHITSNAEFTPANGVIAGSGTATDPYIIGGWEIDANGGSYCIWIENTDAYFVIQDCKVYGATNSGSAPYGSGIALLNVINGVLDNNTCNNSYYGIYLDGCSHTLLVNNNVSSNAENGIQLYSSSYNYIESNYVYGNLWGISLSISDNNSIANNTISEQIGNGIFLDFANYNNINHNNVSNNTWAGIRTENSDNNTLTNNTLYGNFNGITLSHSSNNIITNNNAYGNSNVGIFLDYSNNNIIINNNASSNSECGIYLSYSSNNNITNNNASGNNYGIYMEYSSNNNIITYNWICNNTNHGIYIIEGSTGNTIHHNYFIGNNGAGKGVSGSCQAYDSVGGNYWYDNTAQEGNYWSNWDGQGWGSPNAYPIDGSAGASDWYPVVEFSQLTVFTLAPLCILLFRTLHRRKHK
ncbi:MAG: NosD domain-containing protein [Thermoplasmata archaeon]